jgi:peptidoglycan/LPS O-acetylase OafA/YrhL
MKRLECLDGLRGVLAVYVLLGHMAPFAELPDWLQGAVSHGGAAVDLFFVLSGLVITQSLLHAGGRARPFLIARGARIFPVFLLVFALAVALQQSSCGFERMPWIDADNPARTICSSAWPHAWMPEIAAHLTMTHGLFPNGVLPDVWVSFLGSAWSLSTEWQFYLLALLVAGQNWGSNSRRLCWILIGVAAAGVAWRLAVPESWQFSRAFLGNKGHFFALGVASVAVVRGESGALIRYGLILTAALAICATQETLGKMLPPLVWTCCLLVQMRPRTPGLRMVGGLLRSSVAGYLGTISYCVYLVNEPIHKLTGSALSYLADGNAMLFTLLFVPAAIGLPILVSAVLHRYLEAPAQRWGRSAAQRSTVWRDSPSVQGRSRGL